MGLLILTASIALQSASAALPLKLEAVPGKGHRITATQIAQDDFDAAMDRQTAMATAACKTLKVRWGRHGFGTEVRDGRRMIVNYVQGFSCIDPATDPYKPAPADWTASPQDDAEALAFLRRYLAAFDAVDAKAGVAMMEPIMEMTATEWTVQPKALARLRGTGSRTFGKPVWSVNPAGAAHPGAYASIAFRGEYSGLAADCGEAMIWRRGPNQYLVTQQNIRVVTRVDVDAGRLKQSDADKMCGTSAW